MKAIRINRFGEPEVMEAEETGRPIPAPDEILAKVYGKKGCGECKGPQRTQRRSI